MQGLVSSCIFFVSIVLMGLLSSSDVGCVHFKLLGGFGYCMLLWRGKPSGTLRIWVLVTVMRGDLACRGAGIPYTEIAPRTLRIFDVGVIYNTPGGGPGEKKRKYLGVGGCFSG